MRFNIPPVREPVFDAFVEIPRRDGTKMRLPIVFDRTTRPWVDFFRNLSAQSRDAVEQVDVSVEPPAPADAGEAFVQVAALLSQLAERNAELEKMIEAASLAGVRLEAEAPMDPYFFGAPRHEHG